MAETEKQSDIASLTVELLSAYLSNNTVPSTDLAGLIQSTRAALTQDSAPAEPEAKKPTFTPAVTARKSLASPDQIISLIDGKPYKTLKRHLSANGLTPETYRERYGLPASYPMVAPAFAAVRRAIAEKIGLGNKTAADPVVSADVVAGADAVEETEVAAPVVATSKKRAAKAPLVKAAKASARKARAIAKPAVASADEVKTSVPEAATSPVEPEAIKQTFDSLDAGPAAPQVPANARPSGAKPKKQPAKRMARTPKPAAKSEASRSVSQVRPSTKTTDVPAVAEKSTRRGKLGLFGKAAANASGKGETANPAPAPSNVRSKRPATKG
jgi:predicted transcriptional regulator